MSNCIQFLMLCVQVLALGGLLWYVIETMKMRKAAQKQLKASLDLIKAATDQVEGMSKPCLTLSGELRDGGDAILAMDGAVGNIIAAQDHGSYVVQNIGNGIALNVQYRFTRANEQNRDLRYIPNLLASQRAALVETIGGFNQEHDVTFEYASIGGRKYRTTLHLNHRVITSFHVEQVTP
jgi:hypothetical protein